MPQEVKKSTKAGKAAVRTLNKLVDFIVLVILILLLLIAVYSLWDSRQVYVEADARQYEVYKPTGKDTTTFAQLQKMNPDVLGWLTVYGTKIDYPLVQSTDSNDEYLNKNAKGEFDASGAVFLDHSNHKDFSDFNTIIFGHHMEHRAMFGDLDKFLTQSFFDSHQYGNLYYNGQNHGVEFFAMLQVDGYNSDIYSPGIVNETAKQSYLSFIQSNAMYQRDIGVTTSDHIILLSTCSADITNGRFVLVGKILDHTVKNPYPNEVKANRGNGVDAENFRNAVKQIPVWAWILILLILILLLYFAYRRRKARRKNRKEKTNDQPTDQTKE